MNIQEVLIRLILAMVFSGIIGYERELSKSNAGIKTHILVGIGATTIALTQVAIINMTLDLSLSQSLMGTTNEIVRTDPSRLIAQVVSGIGFLGAGTIIVTKRNISGLTTAGSIWSVASLSIALGMGFYTIAIASFIVTFMTLILLKRVVQSIGSERILIKYLRGDESLYKIETIFSGLDLKFRTLKYSVAPFGNEYVYTNVFEIDNPKQFNFSKLIDEISHIDNIVSVERTNLD